MAKAEPLFVFAHGAGAGSAHPWMSHWTDRLRSIGNVHTFDYPYVAKGKGPDRLPKLIEAHRLVLRDARRETKGPVFLIGKSMGGRVGCHLALEEPVNGVICLGYPLCGGGDRTKLRDEVLLELKTSILFVQGTRDKLCPLDLLAEVRARMRATNDLHVVDGGDHSLIVTKTQLKLSEETQESVDLRILSVIRSFVAKWT